MRPNSSARITQRTFKLEQPYSVPEEECVDVPDVLGGGHVDEGVDGVHPPAPAVDQHRVEIVAVNQKDGKAECSVDEAKNQDGGVDSC